MSSPAVSRDVSMRLGDRRVISWFGRQQQLQLGFTIRRWTGYSSCRMSPDGLFNVPTYCLEDAVSEPPLRP